jgi:hypothetical protein
MTPRSACTTTSRLISRSRVAGQRPLAADEMVLVDPFPRARLETVAHPLAVHQVHDQHAAGGQSAAHGFEDREIVLRPIEIAERVAEDADAVEFAVAEAKAAGVTLVERHRQPGLPGALARQADQVARAVEPGDLAKAAARQFQRMPALAAAQVENAEARFGPGAADQQVDFLPGIGVVLDDVAIGFEVERVEQRAPPLRR